MQLNPMKIKLILLATLLTSFAWSQTYPKSLSLEEAIEFGMKNNRSIINADREILKAKKERWKTIAIGLPQISSEINYQNFLEMPVSLVPAEFFGGEVGTFRELTFGTKQNMIGSVKMEQLLFDGSYLVGLEASRVYLKISENLFEKTNLEVKKLITTTYTNVLIAQYTISFLEKNKKTLEVNLTEIHQLFKNGFEEEESVEQMQLSLAQVNSQLKYAQNLVKITKEMVKFVIGYPTEKPLVLESDLETIFNEEIYFKTSPEIDDIQNNIDIKIADNNVKSESLQFKYEKSKSLPKLSGFINQTYTGNSDEFTFTERNQKWFGSTLVGLTLKVPLFSSLGRTAVSQKAKISLDQAITELTDTQERVRIEVKAAYNDYQLAIDNYFTEKENLRLAERIEKKNQTKFFEGMVQSFELRMAQMQLYTAQNNFVTAIQSVINKKTALETLLNKTF
ncbi:MAG: transporter [Flavobacteriales bacterium MED-G15]|nr:MAG: transporter [Flavobacteriales bacterium MED-G15]